MIPVIAYRSLRGEVSSAVGRAKGDLEMRSWKFEIVRDFSQAGALSEA